MVSSGESTDGAASGVSYLLLTAVEPENCEGPVCDLTSQGQEEQHLGGRK